MDQHTLDKLQFDQVRRCIASCCACSLGKTLARRIEPARKAEVIRRWFEQVQQMEAAAEGDGLPPLGGVTDIRHHVRDAGTPAGLDSHELKRVSETLAATSNINRWAASLTESTPLINAIAERIGDFGPVAAQIDRAIDERSRVRDDASPRLLEIRRSIEQARQQIDHVFARLLKQPRIVSALQYPNPTIREDRRVLPLKTEYRAEIKGIVHRSSDTGATLFIEPAEVVQLNNAIVSLRDDERKEVSRILGELSFLVHQNGAEIIRALDAIAVLDLIAAKVRYRTSRDGVCPEIRDDQVLELPNARHPLLLELSRADDGREVVPIDARLGSDFDLLIITGPNTGGKTVALKTVGLLAIMAQCGIPIPAGRGAKVPAYRQVFIDVGDEQSIEQSLSTFSSHLSNILHMIGHASEKSLVLLDELGAGTDPDEGAGIGRAIMDELLRAKCSAIVTTHLSALKAIAFTNDRVENASVEFDSESLKPTYKLRIGEPGNSNALIVAQRLGMPKRLVQRARSFLNRKSQVLNAAIAGTLDSRRQAERARLDANNALLEAEQQRIHYMRELSKLEREREAHVKWFEWVNTLSPGDAVFVRKFDCPGKVVRMQLHRQVALVNTGTVDLEVGLAELSPPPKDGRQR